MTQDYKPVKTNKVGGSPFKGVLGWVDDRLPIFRMFKYEYLDFQVPRSLNYFWSFGGILMFCLLGLIITGLTLGMHYKPSADDAFISTCNFSIIPVRPSNSLQALKLGVFAVAVRCSQIFH